MPLKSPFRFLTQSLSGHDIFISYRWKDAKSYANSLAEQLEEKGFTCFLDDKGLRKGELISDTLRRAIRRSTMFVLVVTDNVAAPDSVWIPQEIEAFPASHKRALVPIDVGGAMKLLPLEAEPWRALKDRNSIAETTENLGAGKAAGRVVTEIEQAFTFKRQEAVAAAKVLRVAVAVAVAVLLMLVIAFDRTVEARNQQRIAGEMTRIAEQKTREAEEKARIADEKTAEALRLQGVANQKSEEAAANARKAKEQETIATENAAKAEEQEAIATRNAELARAEQQRAEERRRGAFAGELAANAKAQLSSDPELSLLLSHAAVRIDSNPETQEAFRLGTLEAPMRAVIPSAPPTEWDKRAVLSPDGTRVALVGPRGRAQIWDTTNSRLIAELGGESFFTLTVNLSADGRLAVTGDSDHKVRVWAAESGQLVSELAGHSMTPRTVYFDDTSEHIVSSSRREVIRWHMDGGHKVLFDDGEGRIINAVLAPNGRYLLSNKEKPFIWDIVEGKIKAELEGRNALCEVSCFSSDSKLVALPGKGNQARIYETETGRLVKELSAKDTGPQVAFSPDGKLLAALGSRPEVKASDLLSNNVIRVWDWRESRLVTEILLVRDYFYEFAFNFDGSYLVATSTEKKAQVWRVSDGSMVQEVSHAADIASAAFSANGKFLVTTGRDQKVKVARAMSSAAVTELRGHTQAVDLAKYSRDGKHVVTAGRDSKVIVWDAASGKQVSSFQTDLPTHELEISNDGSVILTAGGKSLDFWALKTGVKLNSVEVEETIHELEVGSVGNLLLVAVDDIVQVWDLAEVEILTEIELDKEIATKAVLCPSGLCVAATERGRVGIWEVSSGELIAEMETPADRISKLVVSNDGRYTAAATYGAEGWVWLTATGELVASLKGHQDMLNDIVFSPDGQRVVTTGEDKTAIVWETATGRPLVVLKGHSDEVKGASFSPDGRMIVTTGAKDRTARVWDAATGTFLAELKGFTRPVFGAAFSPVGESVLVHGDDSVARIYPRELFIPFESVREMAAARVTRRLTDRERERYLHQTPLRDTDSVLEMWLAPGALKREIQDILPPLPTRFGYELALDGRRLLIYNTANAYSFGIPTGWEPTNHRRFEGAHAALQRPAPGYAAPRSFIVAMTYDKEPGNEEATKDIIQYDLGELSDADAGKHIRQVTTVLTRNRKKVPVKLIVNASDGWFAATAIINESGKDVVLSLIAGSEADLRTSLPAFRGVVSSYRPEKKRKQLGEDREDQ